jgi:hypothetical protein
MICTLGGHSDEGSPAAAAAEIARPPETRMGLILANRARLCAFPICEKQLFHDRQLWNFDPRDESQSSKVSDHDYRPFGTSHPATLRSAHHPPDAVTVSVLARVALLAVT